MKDGHSMDKRTCLFVNGLVEDRGGDVERTARYLRDLGVGRLPECRDLVNEALETVKNFL